MQTRIHFTKNQKEKLLEWAHDLETTDLKQGEGLLRSENDEYCCLGIYVQYTHPDDWRLHKDDAHYSIRGAGREKGNLPHRIRKELGIHRYLVENPMDPIHDLFITMNDRMRLSFPEIAQEIRYIVENGTFSETTMHFLLEDE